MLKTTKEILNNVKQLLLIPKFEATTIQGVADYYEVNIKAISSINQRHKEILNEHNIIETNRNDFIRNFNNASNIVFNKQYVEFFITNDYSVKIANGKTLLFPIEVIIEIGIRLKNSPIAIKLQEALGVFHIRKEINFSEHLKLYLNELGYSVITQYSVLNYRIDFYLPEVNIAIEFDEFEHKYRYKQDLSRQLEIEEYLKCKFIRIHEDIPFGQA